MEIFWRKCSMAAVLAFLSCVLCAGSAHAAPTDLSIIKAAVPRNFPPQYSTDSSGNPQGFAIDVINHVAALAHCSIEFYTYENWEAVHNALQNGDVDIIPNMGINGTERITEIVKAMKYFSHPDSDEVTAVQLNEAIKTTITIARNEWKYSADVETHLDPSLPSIMGHAGDINQVLLNLLVNAAHAVDAKYQREGMKGLITISSRSSSQGVEISITDSGDGIPEAYQHQIFDPFFTTKEVGKGTGQGLAISHSIIEKHKGSIDFTTEPGHGTTFTIRLPHNGE